MLLVRDIAAAVEATGRLRPDEFLTLTRVRGPSNAHLVGSGEDEAAYHAPRACPLPPDAPVHGAFLTLRYNWHDPSVLLDEHASLAELEASVLGRAGVLNWFVDLVLAFLDGAPRGYELRGPAGELLARGGSRACTDEAAWAVPVAARKLVWAGG